ncbi:MAG: glycosyltransferase family 4 protein [Chloroflexi bacterium]|nr:MAG: glycosyltransferase family 4 protein [Chloroflexota bacterium]
MGAPMAWDPCLVPIEHLEMPGPPRIRVVEILATGTNGGAQEHLFSLMSRLDTAHYDASVVALSAGSAVRKMERNGIAVTVIDEPDDGEAVRALTVHLALIQPDVVHTHMYRADVVGTKAVMALAAGGHRRPYIVSTVHSSRVRSAEDRELIRQLTPQMDQLIAVSKSIEKKIADEHRTGAPVRLIYNGVDLQQYDHQEPCCTLRDEYGMEPGSQIVGVVARLEPEKGHQTLIEAWPNVLRECPDAYLLIVGEGSRRDFLEQWAAAHKVAHRVIFTGRRDDVPAVTAALDVAVLPSWREAQGLSILEAMALSRPVVASDVGGIPEMIEDGVTGLLVDHDNPNALAAAIVRLLKDHAFADLIARAGHDLVHERFCVELMVKAIEGIYDQGARAVRLVESAAS